MLSDKDNIEFDNIDISAEGGFLVIVFKAGDEPVGRWRIEKKNRGKIIWTMWKMHRRALKWRNIPSQTTEGDGSTKETE
ncbi:hypothetical protein KNV00_gp073 [Streptomyces phage Bmoc]|uniref:Uncharacterized protein n=1 Tax=Streptomyces phage Bmoc TaxID=2725629 RepID=A0A6M3SY92_9CAUD|nr:hypothetical protein KNV00_gp073 [Streptomyces phage Bmoc]QJD50946.1 hypothetical protein SEA_BMOC_238 [Streptomyces phage Bmoc]